MSRLSFRRGRIAPGSPLGSRWSGTGGGLRRQRWTGLERVAGDRFRRRRPTVVGRPTGRAGRRHRRSDQHGGRRVGQHLGAERDGLPRARRRASRTGPQHGVRDRRAGRDVRGSRNDSPDRPRRGQRRDARARSGTRRARPRRARCRPQRARLTMECRRPVVGVLSGRCPAARHPMVRAAAATAPRWRRSSSASLPRHSWA